MSDLLATTIVGSMPQPNWLIDRDNLGGRLPPRVRAREIWRVVEPYLEEAQDDATLLAIRDQELAGIDIVGDGEMRRESYSNRFATALSGVDIDNPGSALDRTGHANPVPRIFGPIERRAPIQVRDVEFLKRHTTRRIKVTIPGPFTMAQQAQNDFYGDEEAAAMGYAAAVNAELRDMKTAGADIIQIDEPYLQARPEKAKKFGVKAINRALDGIPGPKAVHLCFGYAHIVHNRPSGYSFLSELVDSAADIVSIEAAQPNLDLAILAGLREKTIMLGVISLGDPKPETAVVVADRIRAALGHVPAERLMLAPDCGMKYIPRDVAIAKLRALSAGAAAVRREITGS